jgi:transcription termination/antitermination protein NusG
MALSWYVVRAISGQEKKVKEYIESELNRMGMSQAVQQILIPTEKVFEMRNGKKRQRERSFLPGYILINAHLTAEIEQAIKDVPGAIGFLEGEAVTSTSGEKTKKPLRRPLTLRESEVNRILGKVDEMDEQGESMDNPYVLGETIKVMDGPFSGFTGLVEEVDNEKKKLKVMVKIFGRNTPLELSYYQVERSV